jgi:hypothetical protein
MTRGTCHQDHVSTFLDVVYVMFEPTLVKCVVPDVLQHIDWSVCLLTLKHLVSLQDRIRSSVQIDLDLHTTPDRWRKRLKKRRLYLFP